jgi:macrolide transport system ATP-binding/permease protein
VLIQATGSLPTLEQDVRRALADVDRRLIVREVGTMEEQVARNFNLERLIATLSVAFGGVALLLASLGLYGVTAYSVSRRTREIGIRMAIGASAGRVLWTVMAGALVQVVAGVVIGVPAAFAAARLLRGTLFRVSGHDPVVLGVSLAVLAAATFAALLIPARSAASTDPIRALRVE